MTMQTMNTAAGRNSFKAAGINPKVKLPTHSTTVMAPAQPTVGHKPGSSIKGFSGGAVIKAKVKV